MGVDVPVRLAQAAWVRCRAAFCADGHLRKDDACALHAPHKGQKWCGALRTTHVVRLEVESALTRFVIPEGVHGVFLDGGYEKLACTVDRAPSFRALGHLQTRKVAAVLEQTICKMLKYLKRRKLLLEAAGEGEETLAAATAEIEGHAELIGSAVTGTQPPAGPSFSVRMPDMLAHPSTSASRSADFERPLGVGRDGFTLHAATRAGGADAAGIEALLKYILRPVVAQERIVPGKDGLVRIQLKRAFSDGTVAIDLDPLPP
jgi:hypothetical protein